MCQCRIVLDALQLVRDNLPHVGFDAVIILLNLLFHPVVALLVGEIGNDGNLFVSTLLALHSLGIHDNLAMKYFLFDALGKVIRYRANEHTLRKAGNLARRNQRIHLRIDGGGFVVAVDGYALPLLQHLSEPFGERFGRFSHDLPRKDIADGVHHDFGLLVPIVARELGEILKAQTYGDLVTSRRGNQIVQPLEIDGRQLVDDNRGFEFPLFTENSLCRGSL